MTRSLKWTLWIAALSLTLLGPGGPARADEDPGKNPGGPTPKTPLPNMVDVPWDEKMLAEEMPEADPDYQSLYRHVPKADFPALREKFNPTTKKPKAFEYEKITHPTGENNPTVYRFDMGPKSSPIEKGFTPVSKDDVFSWEKGWGWEESPAADYLYSNGDSVSTRRQADFELVQLQQMARAFAARGKAFDQNGSRRFDNAGPMRDFFLDDLSRDAVLNPDEIVFKVALPDGRYSVSMILGDVQLPRYGMDVYANGYRVASEAYTQETPWPTRVSFTSNVVRNNLRIAVRANDSPFVERSEVAAEPPDYAYGRLPFTLASPKKSLMPFFGKMMNIHGPATQMGIAGIVISPYKTPPLELVRQKIQLAEGVQDKAAVEGVAKYNAGDRAAAEKSFAQISDSDYRLKADAYLCLAGHLESEVDDELRCLDKAVGLLEDGLKANPDDAMAGELLRLARMHRGGTAYYARWSMPSLKVEGLPNDPFPGQDSQDRSFHRRRCSVLFTWAQPGEILYAKALMRYGRLLGAGDPARALLPWQAAEEAFLKLQDQEPGNRFSNYFLYGDTKGWDVPDYTKNTKGAPPWAVMLREAYNRQLDQAAWWGQQRSQADGSIGGGWGDDVEIGQVWAILALLNPDANPAATETARAICEGVWWSGEIDRDTGFFDGIADVEHTAEWTGDSQPYLLAMDYGNPLYFERSLKTAKLMRDLWMGRTPRGHLHFKSMVLGNKAIGHTYGGVLDADIDCPLNGRATTCAYWDWWYSPLEGLDQLFVPWAEAWLDDSMREENGKPAGVIPGPIGYRTDTLGGNDAKVWRQGAPGTNSYENPTYTNYILSLFGRMHSRTGDAEWLKPRAVKLSSAGVDMDKSDSVPDLGAEVRFPDKYERLKSMNMEKLLEVMRNTWPSTTSENANTDRIAMPGLNQMLDLLTGGDIEFGLDFIPMTLADTSGDVAFMNVSSSQKGAKTLFYNFSDTPEPVSLRLWKLQVGAEHDVKIGVDKNDDDNIDQVLQTLHYRHAHRGDAVKFTLPSRKPIVVDVEQVKPGTGMPKKIIDLAMAEEDIDWKDGKLLATIHNIGNDNCGSFEATVWQGEPGRGKLLQTLKIDGLEAPNDLEPRTVTKSIDWTPPTEATLEKPVRITVKVDPEDKYYEITEQNNVKSRAFPIQQKSYRTPRMWKTIAAEHNAKQWEPFPADFPKGQIR